jgi:hypothetical protein
MTGSVINRATAKSSKFSEKPDKMLKIAHNKSKSAVLPFPK